MIFQKIINREIEADIVFENEHIIAFRDINPKAKVHILIIPKDSSIESINDIDSKNSNYIREIFEAIPKIAKAEGLEKGYRVITNCGEDARQEIKHLHFHILGGELLKEC